MRTAHLPTNSGMRSSTCWPSLPRVLQFILTPHFQSTSPDNWHVGRNNIAPSLEPGAWSLEPRIANAPYVVTELHTKSHSDELGW